MSERWEDGLSQQVMITGVNFRTAPLAIREKLAIGSDQLIDVLNEVSEKCGAREAVVVSTCNRFELVTSFAEDQLKEVVGKTLTGSRIFKQFSHHKDADSFIYRKFGENAAQHLFSVASGVDSLVVGETQIAGQLKRSFEHATKAGTAHGVLNKLFSMAFATAKQVRSSTKIGEGSVSVSSVARELAEQIFGSLEEATVLIIGAGEIGELTLRHLHAAGVRRFFIANRSYQRAIDLAKVVSGAVISLEQIATFLPNADIVIGASWRGVEDDYYLTKEELRKSLEARNNKPQFLIDLSVPRNFDQEINQLSDAFLYNIDDFQEIVADNQHSRVAATEQAMEIISREAEKFGYWLQLRKLSPIFHQLQSKEIFRERTTWQLMKSLRRNPLDQESCQALSQMLEVVVERESHDRDRLNESVVKYLNTVIKHCN